MKDLRDYIKKYPDFEDALKGRRMTLYVPDNMKNLRIESVAIRDKNNKIWTIPKPGRHNDVLRKIREADQEIINLDDDSYGFLLSDGTFARRVRARMIAELSNQLLPNAINRKELYSEDIW